jgi:hypothetical protein
MSELGVIDDVLVYQYRIDLGAADIVREEERFGEAVRNIL